MQQTAICFMAGSANKEVPVWLLVPFPFLPIPFTFIFFPAFPVSLLAFVSISCPGARGPFPKSSYTRSADPISGSGFWWVHFVLKITLPVIALLQKFLYSQVPVFIIFCESYRYGFSEKKRRMFSSRPRKCWYGILVHTVQLPALTRLNNFLVCLLLLHSPMRPVADPARGRGACPRWRLGNFFRQYIIYILLLSRLHTMFCKPKSSVSCLYNR